MNTITRIHKKFVLAVAAAIIIGAAVPVFAGVSNNVDVDIEVPQVLELYWEPTDDGSLVQLTGPNKITTLDFLAGYLDKIDGGTLVVAANVTWDLTVVADNVVFLGGSGTKPSSDVFIDTDVVNTYPYRLDGLNPVTLYRGHVPDVSGHKIYYKVMLNAADSAGIYSLNLTYTLIKN
jgi:hypothetical protein